MATFSDKIHNPDKRQKPHLKNNPEITAVPDSSLIKDITNIIRRDGGIIIKNFITPEEAGPYYQKVGKYEETLFPLLIYHRAGLLESLPHSPRKALIILLTMRRQSYYSKKSRVAALLDWLPQFSSDTTDPLILCRAAYNARHAPQIATLEALRQELIVAPQGTAESFRSVKHLVGRLAEKIRTPANLVNDSLLLRPLLDSYEIRRVEAPVAAKIPMTDGLRNLDSIIRRMLPADDPRLEDLQVYLGQLDGSMGLEDAIRAISDDEERQHNVHAEIQMLEEFHRNQRKFVAHDRYIACSKLACFCCKLYFKWHPGRFVEPECHQKTYLNWRPIDLPERVESEYWPDQRRVLANLSKELSNLVEEQIIAQQQPIPWHPDSITNITAVMGSVAISEVGEVFESGDGESDVTDSDSLAHLNDDETVDNTDNESGESDEESDGGVGLGY
ncbi:hypothetical protein BFJ71_g320 [Fusarium oxysporum]|nr:hypothetical protein BFJ71_g320 [Fusarium oxysporum]